MHPAPHYSEQVAEIIRTVDTRRRAAPEVADDAPVLLPRAASAAFESRPVPPACGAPGVLPVRDPPADESRSPLAIIPVIST